MGTVIGHRYSETPLFRIRQTGLDFITESENVDEFRLVRHYDLGVIGQRGFCHLKLLKRLCVPDEIFVRRF